MKSKKTLKQKICLGICAVSLCAIGGGFTLFAIGTTQKNNKLEEYQKSAEYKQTITQELVEVEQKYNTSEHTLESLEEFYKDSTKIYSWEYAETLIKNSDSKEAKEYRSKRMLGLAGGITCLAGLASYATAFTLGYPIKTKKENNEETKEITK